MIQSQLIDSIKREVKLSGTNELDTTIGEIIDQELLKYAAKTKYSQFFVKDAQLLLEAATESIDLPADLQHFLPENIRYFEADFENDDSGTELKPYNKRRSIESGNPIQFIRQGNSLLLTPYKDIASGDYLLIDYYAFPVALGASDPFPIANLEATIRQEVMARCSVFTDIKRYPMYKAQAKEAYIADRSAQ